MVLAKEVVAIRREKMAVMKIQAERQMPAAVFKGHQLALKTCDETLRPPAAALEGESNGIAFRNIAGARDLYLCHAANLSKC